MSNQTQIAYEKLRQAIINGELKPGERLIEQQICHDFKIGRSPLRETLRLLQMEGYVDFVPNKGAAISKISPGTLAEIYDVVATLEGYAAEIGTKSLTKLDLNKLRKIQDELIKAGNSKEYRKWIILNSQFHDSIVKTANNIELYKIIRNLRDKIRRYRYMTIINPDSNLKAYIAAHEKILETMAQNKAKQAGSEIRKHVLESKQIVIAFMKQFPEL